MSGSMLTALLIALPGKLAEGSFSDPPCFAGKVQQVEYSKALKSWTTSDGERGARDSAKLIGVALQPSDGLTIKRSMSWCYHFSLFSLLLIPMLIVSLYLGCSSDPSQIQATSPALLWLGTQRSDDALVKEKLFDRTALMIQITISLELTSLDQEPRSNAARP